MAPRWWCRGKFSRGCCGAANKPLAAMSVSSDPAGEHRRGWFRWVICLLLFLATTINYVDRQIIGLLKSTLMAELNWDQTDFSNIVLAFQAAYAVGYAGGGWFMDRVGLRFGYAAAVLIWSIAAAGHALARTVTGFSVARFALGL